MTVPPAPPRMSARSLYGSLYGGWRRAPRAARRPGQDSGHVARVHGVGADDGAIGAGRKLEPRMDGPHFERGASEQHARRPSVYFVEARQELSLARRRGRRVPARAAGRPQYAVVDKPPPQARRFDPRHGIGLVRNAPAQRRLVRPRQERRARLQEQRAGGRLVSRLLVPPHLLLAHAHPLCELALRHAEAYPCLDQRLGQPLKVAGVDSRHASGHEGVVLGNVPPHLVRPALQPRPLRLPYPVHFARRPGVHLGRRILELFHPRPCHRVLAPVPNHRNRPGPPLRSPLRRRACRAKGSLALRGSRGRLGAQGGTPRPCASSWGSATRPARRAGRGRRGPCRRGPRPGIRRSRRGGGFARQGRR